MSKKGVKQEVCATCQRFCEERTLSDKECEIDGVCDHTGEPTGKSDTCEDHLIIV